MNNFEKDDPSARKNRVGGKDDNAVRMFLLSAEAFINNALRVDTADDNSIHVRNWTGQYCTLADFQGSS